jgi:histidine triad (HIT) family protein
LSQQTSRRNHGSIWRRNEAIASQEGETAQRETESPGRSRKKEQGVSDCLFCKIVAGEIPSAKVHETDDIYAFRDINPQAPQHILVVPKRHIEKLDDLQGSDALAIGQLIIETTKLARQFGMNTQGYRLVINNGEEAGQSVWHLHAHLLSGRPFRWPPG